MIRGLTTVTFTADDIAAAGEWYTKVLGIEPYYETKAGDATAYIEFRIGDYQHELGFIARAFAPWSAPRQTGGPVTYWHVDDVHAAYERLLALGAESHLEPTEHSPGYVTASVVDPFGNVFGVMFNQHYLDVLAGGGSDR